MITIRSIPVRQLSAELGAAWSALQQGQPALSNPFYRPEFAQAVAAERSDVEVAVLEQAGASLGFLPLERSRRQHGAPVGSHINECQGAIVRPGVDWSPEQVLRAVGLRSWRFDHLGSAQAAFAPFQHVVTASPYFDSALALPAGPPPARSGHVEELERRGRKAAREIGPLRLEMNDASPGTLRRLLDWKIDQCRRTQVPCHYHLTWVVRLFERLRAQSAAEFSGSMFALYFGDRLAAAFFGVRSREHVNGIIFGFDRELQKFSPGGQLLRRVAAAAAAHGIRRIDMGKGSEPYKAGFASASDTVGEGAVYAHERGAALHRHWFRAKDRLRSSSLRSPLRRVRRWMMSARIWMGFAG